MPTLGRAAPQHVEGVRLRLLQRTSVVLQHTPATSHIRQ